MFHLKSPGTLLWLLPLFFSLPLASQMSWQRDFTDRSFGSSARFYGAARFPEGRLCVCGTTEETYNDRALLIAAFDTSLYELWTVRDTNRTPALPEYKIHCAADPASGNLIIAGSFFRYQDESLYPATALVSYDSTGQMNWKIDVPVDFAEAQALRVDNLGNIYLGLTAHYNGYNESAILKYSRQGVLIWQQNYPAYATADVYEIREIIPGNTPAEGGICAVVAYHRIQLFAFSAANGNITWTSPLLGISDQQILYGNTVRLPSGGCAVGYSATAGSLSQYNMHAACFQPNYALQWTAQYDDGQNLNEFVQKITATPTQLILTGQGFKVPGMDILTVALDLNTGNKVWSARKNGHGLDDAAADVVADPAGNAYLAGFFETGSWYHDAVVIQYNPAGQEVQALLNAGDANQEWEHRALLLDTAANRLYPAGVYRRFDRPLMPIFPFHMALSVQQRALPAGTLLRQATAEGFGKGSFSGRWVKTDAGGNIYFAGYRNLGFTVFDTPNFVDIFDLILLKYNTAGELLWHYVLDPETHEEQYPPEIGLLDAEEHPVFIITQHRFTEDKAIDLVRISPDGHREWQTRLTQPNAAYSEAYQLTLTPDHHYLLALRDDNALRLQKVSQAGESLWNQPILLNTPGCTDFRPVYLDVASDGSCVLNASLNNCWTPDQVYRVSADGQILWSATLEGEGSARDILIDGPAVWVMTENRLKRFSLATGQETFSRAWDAGDTGRKLFRYQNNLVAVTTQKLLHLSPTGAVVFEKDISLPAFIVPQTDHLVLPDIQYNATVINYYGDTLALLTCTECATYNPFYPQVPSNNWGWGAKTLGLDAREGYLYWGGLRDEPLHSNVPTLFARGSNVLHLVKYGYAGQINATTDPASPDPGYLRIVPNPSDGYFTLYLDQELSPSPLLITIRDASGRIVRQWETRASGAIKAPGKLLPGFYAVEVYGEAVKARGMVIVQRG